MLNKIILGYFILIYCHLFKGRICNVSCRCPISVDGKCSQLKSSVYAILTEIYAHSDVAGVKEDLRIAGEQAAALKTKLVLFGCMQAT